MSFLPIIHLSITVTGTVQGVRYRWSTREEARRLHLVGTVRNLKDGSVKVEVEGPRNKLDDLIDWCRHGPPMAVVENLDIMEGPPTGYSDFSIIR